LIAYVPVARSASGTATFVLDSPFARLDSQSTTVPRRSLKFVMAA
jgi:hypothetical protein